MVDFTDTKEVIKLEPVLQHIGLDIGRAVREGCRVSIRVEDAPNLTMDSEFTTTLTSASINEESKYLYLNGDNLRLMFHFEEYSQGTESMTHNKFYFHSKGASLTVVIKF